MIAAGVAKNINSALRISRGYHLQTNTRLAFLRTTFLALTLLLSACVVVEPEVSDTEAASAINVELGIGYLQQENFI